MVENLDPFESPRLLLAGAARHLNSLRSQIQEFRERPGAIVIQPPKGSSPYPNMLVAKIGFHLPPELKQIAFDVVHNLRSALDQATYGASTTLVKRDLSHTKFPFGDTEIQAASEIKGRAKEVPPALFAFLMAFKPFEDGNRPLWGLNKLRNTKSHRILVPVLAQLNPQVVGQSQPGLMISEPTWNPGTGELKIPFQPAKVGASAAAIVVHMEVLIGTGAFCSEPAIGVFDHLLCEVDRIVSDIEAETARLVEVQSGESGEEKS